MCPTLKASFVVCFFFFVGGGGVVAFLAGQTS